MLNASMCNWPAMSRVDRPSTACRILEAPSRWQGLSTGAQRNRVALRAPVPPRRDLLRPRWPYASIRRSPSPQCRTSIIIIIITVSVWSVPSRSSDESMNTLHQGDSHARRVRDCCCFSYPFHLAVASAFLALSALSALLSFASSCCILTFSALSALLSFASPCCILTFSALSVFLRSAPSCCFLPFSAFSILRNSALSLSCWFRYLRVFFALFEISKSSAIREVLLAFFCAASFCFSTARSIFNSFCSLLGRSSTPRIIFVSASVDSSVCPHLLLSTSQKVWINWFSFNLVRYPLLQKGD